MSGLSNVGTHNIYEANEQRTLSDQQIEEAKKENRFHEGKEHSHKALDSSKSISFLIMLLCIFIHTLHERNAQCFCTNLS